ncbi:hypothetical protein WG66_014293 [Moniliophthora roreri]|uniref:Uncharacterized protein n=1 Tax=Moniliophthora roreri TaxID=221103 RepID=A0A0W0GD57_MONRR|nr:hypothetical protein WG66_014293 [Moniliophthora roreri]
MATDQLQEPHFLGAPRSLLDKLPSRTSRVSTAAKVLPGPFSEIAAIQKFSSSLVVLLPATAVTHHHVNITPTTFVIAPNALNVVGVVIEGKFVQLLKHH